MQKIRDLLFFCGELFSCFIYLSVAAICISCSGKKINDSPPIDDSVITKNVSFKNGRDNVIGQDSLGICNEVVSRDTINIQTWLQKAESILNDYKHIHITNASDTLKYSNLDKKYIHKSHCKGTLIRRRSASTYWRCWPSSGMKESLIKPEKRTQPIVELSIYRYFH